MTIENIFVLIVVVGCAHSVAPLLVVLLKEKMAKSEGGYTSGGVFPQAESDGLEQEIMAAAREKGLLVAENVVKTAQVKVLYVSDLKEGQIGYIKEDDLLITKHGELFLRFNPVVRRSYSRVYNIPIMRQPENALSIDIIDLNWFFVRFAVKSKNITPVAHVFNMHILEDRWPEIVANNPDSH